MSDTHKAIQQLFAVLDTAESQLGAVFGLTLSFEDGLALRTKAFERSDTFLHKCGYTSGVVTLATAGGMSDEALLAVIGVGIAAPAALGTTTVTPGEDPGPLSVEPEELEPIDEGPVTIEPVEIEPISLIPDATEELIQHNEPEPEPAIPEESDDATQLFAQGAIPVDWEDDDGESTVVMTRDAAAAMMAEAEEEHFDLISPEEVEPEEIEPEEIEPEEIEPEEIEPEEIEPEEIEPETLTPIDNPPDADLPLDDATDEVPVKASTPIASRAQVPTVRAASERPGAAAIQIGGPGGARVIPPEEDEEIAVEAAPDDEDYEYDSEGGFGLSLSEDDDEEYEEEEEEEAPPAPPPAPIVIPPGPSQEVIQGFIDRARRESEDGSLEEAARSYSDALDGQPRQAEVRLARGRIFMDMGDYSRAISDFLIAEEITPDSAEPQVLMGELYSHRKDYAKAQGYLDIALRLNPRHPMAYYRRGLCFIKTREFSKAVDDLGRARALDDSLPGIDHFLGQAMKKAKPTRK